MTFKIGDKVRIVHHDEATGVVAGELTTSPVDGGPRLSVRWDRTGKVNEWDPAFLRSVKTRACDDPPEVISNDVVARRGGLKFVPGGVSIVERGGFFRLPGKKDDKEVS